MGELENNFSWSNSRNQTFNDCKRKYFYSYYGYWNGWGGKYMWDKEKDPEKLRRRLIYQYKNMTSLDLVFGSSVHEEAKQLVLAPSLDKTVMAGYVKQKLHNACVHYIGDENWKDDPKMNPALVELVYGGGWSSESTKKAVANIKMKMSSLGNFFDLESYKELVNGNVDKKLEIDEPFNDKTMVGVFQIEDSIPFKVFAKIDYLYLRSDGMYVITDWKTNKRDFDKRNPEQYRQLYIYADYASRKYNIPLEKMICRYENVITGHTDENSVTKYDIQEIEDYIRFSAEDMKSYVVDCDISEDHNVALPETSYSMTQTARCKLCNFRNICGSNCGES